MNKKSLLSIFIFPDCSAVKAQKEPLLSMFVSLFSDSSPSLRSYGVAGVIGMVSITDLMNPKECYLIADHLSNLVLADSDDSVR
jgi:hypothetical protein